jgi:hypothetical protein
MSGPDDTARRFLLARFPELLPGETIEIRPIGPRGTAGRRWFENPADAAAYALALDGGRNVYYGLNPRRGKGGTKADVARITQLHVDVDFKQYPDGRDGALASIGRFPVRPTYVVESGGGFQVGYGLADPIPVASPDDPAVPRVEGLLKRLYQAFGGLDPVQDIGRIFRLPGTLNYKYDPPRPVTLARHDPDLTYTLEGIASVLPPLPPAPPRPARAPRPDEPPELAELRAMLAGIPQRLSYDEWLHVLMAVHEAYPGPEGVALCEDWSPGYDGEIGKKFASFKRTGVGIGTLVHLAKQHGWRPPERPAPAPTPAAAEAPRRGPELAGVAEDVLARIRRLEANEQCLRAALAERDAELRRLRADNERLIDERRLLLDVQRNPKIKTERDSIIAAAFEVASKQRRGEADAEGWVRVPVLGTGPAGQPYGLSIEVGKSPARVSAHLDAAHRWGILEKKLVYDEIPGRPDLITGEIGEPQRIKRTCLRLPVPLNDTLARLKGVDPAIIDPDRQAWGGERPRCPDHPEAATTEVTALVERHVIRCAVCRRVLARTARRVDRPARTFQDGRFGAETTAGLAALWRRAEGPTHPEPFKMEGSDDRPADAENGPGAGMESPHCGINLNTLHDDGFEPALLPPEPQSAVPTGALPLGEYDALWGDPPPLPLDDGDRCRSDTPAPG